MTVGKFTFFALAILCTTLIGFQELKSHKEEDRIEGGIALCFSIIATVWLLINTIN